MKIAAIDLGTNSIHMVVAEVASSGAFRVLDREAESVRLGAGGFSAGALTQGAMDRAFAILRTYKQLARIHKVEEIVAVATSAVREATNGEDFLERIGRKTGIWPRAISGEEEAKLIYWAALHSIHLGGRRAVVVDIGGGSVEIVLGKGTTIHETVSLKLGALRMTEEFVGSDPIAPREEKRLVARVRELLDPVAAKIRRAGFERVVGTSGTILSLGRMALAARTGAKPESLHHASVGADAIHAVCRKLVSSDLRRRLKLPGMDRRRADILPAGALVLDTILTRLDARELTLCDWALREGMLLDYVTRRKTTLARAEAYPDVRRRSVVELAERWSAHDAHARHVARLALDLFDASSARHGLEHAERELLEYAALLHDVGHHISHSQHHKHSYYLIKNSDLRGFDPQEIELMANVTRYHRGGGPSKRHAGFAALGAADRRRVEILAAFVRLAEALDRGHRQRVRSVGKARSSGKLRLRCASVGDVELETWGARRHLDPLQEALELPVELEFTALEGRRRSARTA